MKRWIQGVLPLIMGVALTGCATSFISGDLPAVKRFPDRHPVKSIYVDVAFSGKLNGKPWTSNDAYNTKYLQQQCEKRLKESGMFGFVSSELKSTDLVLHVAIINEKRQNPTAQTLSGFTLFIVPYKSSDDFRLLAAVKNPRTGEEKTINLNTTVSHWQSLFLIPFSPFNRPSTKLETATDRLIDNLVMELHRSGMVN